MVFITNFNNSRELADIKDLYDRHRATNINFLLDDFQVGSTKWTVDKGAAVGDIVVFMCAKEARHNLGTATSHIPDTYSQEFRDFVDEQKALYKQYSGGILGCGIVASALELDADGWWADINQLCQFVNPIYIDEFRSFISISRTSAITRLSDEQWDRLKWLVNCKNPAIFPGVEPPDVKVLEKDFSDAVHKATQKSLDQLKKSAAKKGGLSTVSTVRAKVYSRDPDIAAYVKKRANGCCQLCGKPAPFIDNSGEPYLECHHVEWLSKGGMDSIDNCVALCPDCHRKMHILNNAEDIKVLKDAAAE